MCLLFFSWELSIFENQESVYHESPTFLLWAGSRAARGKITASAAPTSRQQTILI